MLLTLEAAFALCGSASLAEAPPSFLRSLVSLRNIRVSLETTELQTNRTMAAHNERRINE